MGANNRGRKLKVKQPKSMSFLKKYWCSGAHGTATLRKNKQFILVTRFGLDHRERRWYISSFDRSLYNLMYIASFKRALFHGISIIYRPLTDPYTTEWIYGDLIDPYSTEYIYRL